MKAAVLAAGVAAGWLLFCSSKKQQQTRSAKRLLLIGYGEVAKQLAEILCNSAKYPAMHELLTQGPVVVVGVITRSKGSIYNVKGLDLSLATQEVKAQGRFQTDCTKEAMDGLHAARHLDYDVLVELSALTIQSRGEPAVLYIRAALERSKHVVSANKGPLAFAYRELHALAQQNGCKFLFESCVMDGCPVFNLVNHCFRGVRLSKIDGILNSTTNIILTAMEAGSDFKNALAKAQAAGIAEADPSNDIEGFDAAAKLAALCNVLMDCQITPMDVEREGIGHITQQDIAEALKQQRRLKLICSASRNSDGTVTAQVRLEKVPFTHEFALVSGSGSIIRLHSDLMTPISVRQDSPGLMDTAYGVLQDVLNI